MLFAKSQIHVPVHNPVPITTDILVTNIAYLQIFFPLILC